MRLTAGPRTANHFWPRLWASARPLGGEARRAKADGCLPIKECTLDDIDSRIFVQGGDWIQEHRDILTAAATSADSATCVALFSGSDLHMLARPQGSNPQVMQGVLQSLEADGLACTFSFHSERQNDRKGKSKSAEYKNLSTLRAELTDEDIWWSLPFWIAAEYKLHFEKIPVERGFYFLVEPGQAFCIIILNWNPEKLIVRGKVDAKWCSKAGWLMRSVKNDHPPVNLKMYENPGIGNTIKGEQLLFARRETLDRPCKGWQEELGLSGAVNLIVSEALDAADFHASDNESESDLGEAEDKPGSGSQTSSGEDALEIMKTTGAAVKENSKWALHLSIAPAAGEEVESGSHYTPEVRGKVVGRPKLHYRGKEWFKTIDLMLQEERMRLDRLAREPGLITGEAAPEGATKDDAICLEDEPAPALPPVAGPAPGGPIRNSKLLKVSFHEGGRGSPVSNVVQVPKTHSVATFKSTVKDALADEDVFGEEIRTARLNWTYIESEGDKSEVDISPFTEASDLESSSALHVYLLPKKRQLRYRETP